MCNDITMNELISTNDVEASSRQSVLEVWTSPADLGGATAVAVVTSHVTP